MATKEEKEVTHIVIWRNSNDESFNNPCVLTWESLDRALEFIISLDGRRRKEAKLYIAQEVPFEVRASIAGPEAQVGAA